MSICPPIARWLLLVGLIPTCLAAEELSFNRDIRPILSDKCFKCHGPDSKNQKSDFRLDSFEHATENLDGVTGIVPGKLEESEVHWRIHSEDPAEVMPPPKAKMALTPAEVDTLDRWIAQGARYEKHWSFQPLPDTVPLPDQENSDLHPIDQFIRRKLQEKNLDPAPGVSREKWLRRVSFDLTGLPPTLAELDAFLSDSSPDAFADAVDRLLHSTAYAERMTAEWMDVARYSDTYGYQVDRNREVWPWRDWVIRAFEDNLPFDQFITWQIGGDLLPNATRDQILATTFNRLHSQKVEGGSVEEEFRIEYIADRLHTFGTAFLGLTMECTRCHDHKYDPLTMQDYYSLSAYFANIDESGLYSFFTPSVPTPTLALPSDEQEEKLAAAETQVKQREAKLREAQASSRKLLEHWKFLEFAGNDHGLQVHLDFETEKPSVIPNLANPEQPAKSNANNQLVTGKFGQAVHLTGDDAINLPKGTGNFSRDQPFSVALWMRVPVEYERAVVYRRSKAWTDAASRGYELLIEDGKLSPALIHFWPGNAIRIRSQNAVPLNQWLHVAVTYDGSSRAEGLALYLDGKPMDVDIVRDSLTKEIVGGGDDFIGLGQRMRDKGFKNGLVDEFRVYNREISALEIGRLADSDWVPDSATREDHYFAAWHDASERLREQLQQARKQRDQIQNSIKEIMVMREWQGEPRKSHILNRGMYDQPGAEVSPATPAVLPAGPEKTGRNNRLDLARWLTMPDHPLTARVTVNRYWQMMFGRGLVSTPEDFGSQGKLPTHPDLLDWLARDFVDHGWDLHRLLKQIALSSTYRQSSKVTSEARERDPENLWLARGPSYKLTAEMIRDNALAVSGLLSEKTGGPSVKPYDLAVSFKPIKPDKGENLYRRSLYTFWKRTGPSPLMMTLDSSKKEVCRVQRERTDSPLQSLVLLNSPQFIEAARVTAQNLLKQNTGDAEIVRTAFRMFTSRWPDEREQDILTALLREQHELFSSHPEATENYLKIGEASTTDGTDQGKLAAATVLVSTLMNFDETYTKR